MESFVFKNFELFIYHLIPINKTWIQLISPDKINTIFKNAILLMLSILLIVNILESISAANSLILQVICNISIVKIHFWESF